MHFFEEISVQLKKEKSQEKKHKSSAELSGDRKSHGHVPSLSTSQSPLADEKHVDAMLEVLNFVAELVEFPEHIEQFKKILGIAEEYTSMKTYVKLIEVTFLQVIRFLIFCRFPRTVTANLNLLYLILRTFLLKLNLKTKAHLLTEIFLPTMNILVVVCNCLPL